VPAPARKQLHQISARKKDLQGPVRSLLPRCRTYLTTQTHQDGLFVCMKCFNGFCSDHIKAHDSAHSHPLYVRIQSVKKAGEEKKEITKLAVGVKGGAVGERPSWKPKLSPSSILTRRSKNKRWQSGNSKSIPASTRSLFSRKSITKVSSTVASANCRPTSGCV
jgi:uncharacterized UBP type Zn finger protein